MNQPLYIGIDVGTSGCRAVAIDADARCIAEARAPLPEPVRSDGGVEQEPELWWQAVEAALTTLRDQTPRGPVHALALDATSGTVLLVDGAERPCGPALMYNDNRAVTEAERIRAVAPPASAAHGTGSGLAKALWLLARRSDSTARIATQADWITARLSGRPGVCDENNVMKLGWDAVTREWPAWLATLGVDRGVLPKVVVPGTPIGRLAPEWVRKWGLSAETIIAAGTTDSTAAIIATGADGIGDAVTSLGSTLVTKVIGPGPIFAPEYGVYSQPLGKHWLIGGGSNSGGAVLKRFFSADELRKLSARINPDRPSGLDYYPLAAPGERFPVNDPQLAPRLSPRPADDIDFLHGLLEGIARIERDAYRKLAELGAPYPARVLGVGGGAANDTWTRMRSRLLGVDVCRPTHTEAAYGAALLAKKAVTP